MIYGLPMAPSNLILNDIETSESILLIFVMAGDIMLYLLVIY